MPSKRERKLISKNRSAHHQYFIDETFECGIESERYEVKPIRERACQNYRYLCTDSWRRVLAGGPAYHPYSDGGVWNGDPDRRRRLLLHRKEMTCSTVSCATAAMRWCRWSSALIPTWPGKAAAGPEAAARSFTTSARI